MIATNIKKLIRKVKYQEIYPRINLRYSWNLSMRISQITNF